MDNIIIDTRSGILSGLEKISRLARRGYGGAGTNVMVQSTKSPGQLVTNDFQTIVQAMKFDDTVEALILSLIKQLCSRTDRLAGDNRKTTVILTEEILKAAYGTDMNVLQLKEELEALIPVIEARIDEMTRAVTVDSIADVARTASESEATGMLLQEVYQQIGKDGMIDVVSSGTPETSYRIIDGIRFDMAGTVPSLFHDDEAEKSGQKPSRAVYENPLVLVTKRKITSEDDINPLLYEMKNGTDHESVKDLVIFTNDMDSDVARKLIELHQGGQYNICIIKAPSLWQDYYFADFAKCTGATIVEDSTGLSLRSLPWSALGTCGKIIVDEHETRIIGHAGISDHVAELQAKGDDDSKLRLYWLNAKTAVIRVGANSEEELAYRRLKTNDAVRSSHLALQHGIVAGGGTTLKEVSKSLPDTVSGRIMALALAEPISQIVKNADPSVIPEFDKDEAYDARKRKVVNVWEAGIVDSSMTVKLAVRNAIGIASTVLTAPDYIPLPKETPEEIAAKVATNRQYGF